MDKILVIGNLGYIGPVLMKYFHQTHTGVPLIGFDTGFFENCFISHLADRSCQADQQIYGDVRNFDTNLLKDVSSIVYLAAISNDPMGNVFEQQTLAINQKAAVDIARAAKANGVENFVFASSCSSYGFGGDTAKSEDDEVNPLTAYAKSKVFAEQELQSLADVDFAITALRFATACGASPRLRLDLVLNDFVANAVVNSKITILSDGSPLRPLIDVQDMAKAIDWACQRQPNEGGAFLRINAGSNDWNFSVREIAQKVQSVFPETDISINADAEPDKRSYKVNFDLFKGLAGEYYPSRTLEQSIEEIAACVRSSNIDLSDFRSSHLMRLNVLKQLKESNRLDNDLYWAV